MAKDIIFLSYDLVSDIPYLRWLYKILHWVLKKKRLLKDYEDLYKTDNGLRVFANSLKKIGVDINKLVEMEKSKIPLAIMFKQKTGHQRFLKDNLKMAGFIPTKKSMGIWILPPKKIKSLGIKDYNGLSNYLHNMIKDGAGELNIRFGVLTDYNQLFTYPYEQNEFKQFISPEIVRYFEVQNILYHLQRIKKQKVSKTQADLVNSTPLQHMFADFVPLNILEKISNIEDNVLNKLKTNELIQEPYFLHLKNIQANVLRNHLRSEGVLLDGETIKSGLDHVKFISERIGL